MPVAEASLVADVQIANRMALVSWKLEQLWKIFNHTLTVGHWRMGLESDSCTLMSLYYSHQVGLGFTSLHVSPSPLGMQYCSLLSLHHSCRLVCMHLHRVCLGIHVMVVQELGHGSCDKFLQYKSLSDLTYQAAILLFSVSVVLKWIVRLLVTEAQYSPGSSNNCKILNNMPTATQWWMSVESNLFTFFIIYHSHWLEHWSFISLPASQSSLRMPVVITLHLRHRSCGLLLDYHCFASAE